MTRRAQPQTKPTPDRLMGMAWGYAPGLIIHAAVQHKIFDLLDRRPRTITQLAKSTGASARGLKAILNALVGLRLLARQGKAYLLTQESAAYLVSTRPGFRGALFQHHAQQLLPQWLHLADVVRTGGPAPRDRTAWDQAGFFARFVGALFPGSYPAAKALAKHLRLSQANEPVSVLDIGAGSGVWGITLAKPSPQVRILAVDWPRVLKVARNMAREHGVADRLRTRPGDFMEVDLGRDHDVAVLGHILHGEGPDQCRGLLRRVFKALKPGGIVAVQEFLPQDDRLGPELPLMFAVNMLIQTEAGDTYTFAEIKGWLQKAGYTRPRLLKTPGPSPLILADKP